MIRIGPRLAAVGLLLVSGASVRADDTPPPMGVWTGKGQAGYLDSRGNSNGESANASLDMARFDGAWKNALYVGGLYGVSNGITSAERWEARWQSNYDINPKLFTFGALRYEHDLFSGFEYQASGSAGMGYKIIGTDATKLTAQLGVGYRQLRPEALEKNASGAVIERIPQASQGDAVLTAEVNYQQNLTTSTSLSNKFLMEYGSNDTLFTDDIALTVKMSTKLALGVGYGLQDNTRPPAGLKTLDTVTSINLVYAF